MTDSAAEAHIGLPEAAARLGIHYMTAYRYVRTGRLPATSVRGTWRIDPADVRTLVRQANAGSAARARSSRRGGPQARGESRLRMPSMLERCLVEGDEAGAYGLCERALGTWATPPDLYSEILVPAMRSIGDRWSDGELSVADEHRASAAAVRLMGRLGPCFVRPGRRRGSVVVGVPAGDFHAIPATMVSDLLRAAGFSVVDLGGDTPAEAFVTAAKRADRLAAVAIGSTLPGNEPAIATTAAALHEALPGVAVIAGGAGVPTRTSARAVGADQWSGADGRQVVRLVAAGSAPHGGTPAP